MSEQTETETEQLIDDITAAETEDQTEEQAEEQAEETTEEIPTEEQLEVARAIAEYETEIEQLDAKLAAFEAESVLDKKREEMRKFNYNDEQVEFYLPHIEGETAEEIRDSVFQLTSEIPPAQDNYADPSPMNSERAKPSRADYGEVGKKAYERVKHKIFPFLRG